MLPIGAAVESKYNARVKGTVIGYGYISDSKAWYTGQGTTEHMRPVYLVALPERIDLTKTNLPVMVSVMVLEVQNVMEGG